MTLKRGGARIVVEWGYDDHEIVLSSRNWSRIKRGGELRVRYPGFSEDGFQWEYWNFAGGLDGDLVVEYGEDGGVGFDGKLHDATIEEANLTSPKHTGMLLKQLPDTSDDRIGSLLAQAAAIEYWTLEKQRLVERALKAMVAAKYVEIRGHYSSYKLTRKGQSCQYNIPDDRRGKLMAFRGMRVRVVCVDRVGYPGRSGRLFLAGPVSAKRAKKTPQRKASPHPQEMRKREGGLRLLVFA